MNARFYDSNTQRFLTQDTYKGNTWEPMSQNLYSYVGNNPVNFVDPTGHCPEDVLDDIYDPNSSETKRQLLDSILVKSDDEHIKELTQEIIDYCESVNSYNSVSIGTLKGYYFTEDYMAEDFYDDREDIKKVQQVVGGALVGGLISLTAEGIIMAGEATKAVTTALDSFVAGVSVPIIEGFVSFLKGTNDSAETDPVAGQYYDFTILWYVDDGKNKSLYQIDGILGPGTTSSNNLNDVNRYNLTPTLY